jgi:hypothetical protein
MPLFKKGNFDQIGLAASGNAKAINVAHKKDVKFSRLLSLESIRELSFNIEPPKLDLAKSDKKWSLKLKSLTLKEDFESWIYGIWGSESTNEIYFTSIAWDYSGQSPFVYPPKGANASDFIIPMKAHTTRQFIGDGIPLWPSQNVVGGLNILLLVYECDSDARDAGERLVAIHDTVQKSQLSALILAISTNPALATGVAIGAAIDEFLGIIGNIMKNDKDDYVDLFEGSYGTDKSQTTKSEKYEQDAAGIELEFTVS